MNTLSPSTQEVEQEDQNFQVTLKFEDDLAYMEPSLKNYFQLNIFVLLFHFYICLFSVCAHGVTGIQTWDNI